MWGCFAKLSFGALGAFGALVMFLAQTPPDAARSNLYLWVEEMVALFGDASLPSWLASPVVDTVGFWSGAGLLAVAAIGLSLGFVARRRIATGAKAGQTGGLAGALPLDEAHERRALLCGATADVSHEFDIENQRKLISALRTYACNEAHVKIKFANIRHRKLADTLVSIFELARWRTDLTIVPLERQSHEYIEGIEVFGYNKHLVEAIRELLAKHGLPGTRPRIGHWQGKTTNPKWKWLQHHIGITIGHH